MKKTGLIGSNVENSLSPIIHNFLFKQYNILGEYKTFSITKEQLRDTTKWLIEAGYIGFNVTIPYKEAIIPLLSSVDSIAAKIGAVNSVSIKNGKLIGYNTDAYGFIKGIKSQFPEFQFLGSSSLVVGAGGASRAILHALNTENVSKIYLCNRTDSKVKLLAQQYSNIIPIDWGEKERVVNRCDLIVNATSLFTHFINLPKLANNVVVNDIIYFPTNLLRQAAKNGVGGLGMLIWQAEKSFHSWFNVFKS